MNRVLLFAGTTEGRQLAQRLAEMPLAATICVATDYGREVLAGLELPGRFTVHTGRLDETAMGQLMQSGGFCAVVDATHPYAVKVSRNIAAAAGVAGLRCLRLLRAASKAENGRCVPSVEEAARLLAQTQGNVLLATGSKELAAYTTVPGYARRLYPRVLPTVESLRQCEALGFPSGHVIAMQGPFGLELNVALMRQFDIRVLVTKDGGAAGGFAEKLEAARQVGAEVVVVGRPAGESGLSMDEVLQELEQFA